MPSMPPWISGPKGEKGNDGPTSSVQNAKKPKERPARGWRDTILFPVRSLPTYSGPYHVGTMEIEVPVREPRTFSGIKRQGVHLLQLKTVLMTVYYPASPSQGNGRPSRQLWLGRPRLDVGKGYGRFAAMPESSALPMFLPTMFTKLPAWKNAPLSDKFPPSTKANAADEKEDREPPTFPMMVFSHGLGGTDTCYSSVCGEFASYGFVVFALEHRDGTGPRTFVNHPDGEEVPLDTKEKVDKVPRFNRMYNGRHYDVIDYIFPKDNMWDTAPNNDKGVDQDLRGAQIDMRLAEIEEAYEVMRMINDGHGGYVYKQNLRRKGYKAASSKGLEGVDWDSWKGRLQLEHVVVAGHSFGAATVTDLLRHDQRFQWASQGIIYDIWGKGTRKPSKEEERVKAPILAINSEAFTYWPTNFETVQNIVEEAAPYPAWLVTVRGTVHVSQSDFSLLYPHLCSLLLKMTANPERAVDVNVNASLEFLRMVMPDIPQRIKDAFPDEGLLDTDIAPLDRIPSAALHRPKEKYTAAKLSIHHEVLWRICPPLARKLARGAIVKAGGHVGDEIWLHEKPDEKSVESYAAKSDASLHRSTSPGDQRSKAQPASVPANEGGQVDGAKVASKTADLTPTAG